MECQIYKNFILLVITIIIKDDFKLIFKQLSGKFKKLVFLLEMMR